MKTKQFYFGMLMVLITMMFTACSSSDEAAIENGAQLKLSAGITAQKAPYDINEWGTKIDLEDVEATTAKISKFKMEHRATRNPVQNSNWSGMSNRNIAVKIGNNAVDKATIDAYGNITLSKPYYFTGTADVPVQAWYPYSATLDYFTVQTDQSLYANYEASDLMYASGMVNVNSPDVHLTFNHRMQKILLTVNIQNANNLSGIKIDSVVLKGTIAGGKIIDGVAKFEDIVSNELHMYNTSMTTLSNTITYKYEALIFPQHSTSFFVYYSYGDKRGSFNTAQVGNFQETNGTAFAYEINLNVLGSGTLNNHAWVRMGLPSNTKWATMNLGANSPSDYGSYYNFGGTSPYLDYTQYYSGSADITPESGMDVARNNWASTWRLPTRTECQELIDYCTWTWTSQGGHNGYLVKSKINSNTIFLPAAGEYETNKQKYDENTAGGFWSSSATTNSRQAYYLHIKSGAVQLTYIDVTSMGGTNTRDNGISIRPVSD